MNAADRLVSALLWLKARALAIALLTAGAVLLIGAAYIKGRADGRAALQAEIDAATVEATHRADEDEQGRRDANQNRSEAINGVIDNAVRDHPEETARPAGPAVNGVLDELRRRSR